MVGDLSIIVFFMLVAYSYKNIRLFSLENVAIDGDDPEHVQWIYKQGLKRAEEFHIQGLTYRLTQGKNMKNQYLEKQLDNLC